MNTVDLSATFSGPNNIINFFMDDALTSLNFPPEAGSGPMAEIGNSEPPSVCFALLHWGSALPSGPSGRVRWSSRLGATPS
jgi:hypothetical protein